MSLDWRWDGKIGEAEYVYETPDGTKTGTYTLYEGNGFLIFLIEYEEKGENVWVMGDFWVDEAHAKRCLGLDKKYTETYGENRYEGRVTKFRINKAKSRNWKKIVKLLVDAFDNIEIDLYTEGE